MLRDDQLERDSRQIILPEVGADGQERLLGARVLIVGLGGLGSAAAIYLAAAGVGTLGLIDDGSVELSNLQRQIIHGTGDVGRPKPRSAADRIAAVNPEITIETHLEKFTPENGLSIVGSYDIAVDGSDNYPTRYAVSDAASMANKPLVHASALAFEGHVTIFPAGGRPCYRCLYPEPPPPGTVPTCQEAGIIGSLAGTLGAIQATEAVKLILSVGEPLVCRLWTYDSRTAIVRILEYQPNPACPRCGDEPTITRPASRTAR
ncbi:adenylyltransferase [candidate division TA06 bacterium SM1_40]|uniref:Adenylyltransferase n=1 Tax=candidate division TA06 bacterium SM1_40 TaxID=1703773 RepID=A0A0S8JLF0_UNCT6|nr:MAG: adenylyltransferase [candidate division TA06 bacterium SM1_40]